MSGKVRKSQMVLLLFGPQHPCKVSLTPVCYFYFSTFIFSILLIHFCWNDFRFKENPVLSACVILKLVSQGVSLNSDKCACYVVDADWGGLLAVCVQLVFKVRTLCAAPSLCEKKLGVNFEADGEKRSFHPTKRCVII